MATIGRAGLSSALVSASSSSVSRMPAQATGANLATPWVEASARCAVPKASITKTSHSAAYFLAVSSTFFFSPLLKRQFSSSTSSPSATSKPPSTQSRIRRTGLPSLSDDHVGHRLERVFFGVHALFRAAQVGGDHHLGAGLQACIDGRHGCGDAGIGSDLAVLDGHVEVGADQDALALEIQIGHFDNGHVSLLKVMCK